MTNKNVITKEDEKLRDDLQRKLEGQNSRLFENERALTVTIDTLREGVENVDAANEIIVARRNLEYEAEALRSVRIRTAAELEAVEDRLKEARRLERLDALAKENASVVLEYDELWGKLKAAVDELPSILARLEKLSKRSRDTSIAAGKIGEGGLPARPDPLTTLGTLGWQPSAAVQKAIERLSA